MAASYTELDDLYLNLALLPLLALAAAAAATRLARLPEPHGRARTASLDPPLQAAPETAASGARSAPLLASAAQAGGRAGGNRVSVPLKLVQALCCALGLVQYAVLLAMPDAPSNQDHGEEPGMVTLYRACWGAACASWLVSLVVVLVELRHSRGTGRAVRTWWALMLVHTIIRLSSDMTCAIQKHSTPADWWVRVVGSVPLLVLGLIAIFEPDTPSDKAYAMREGMLARSAMHIPPEEQGEPNSEATASFFSRATFAWLSKLLYDGSLHPLEHPELYSLQEVDDSTEFNAMLLARCWQAEVETGRRSFFHAMHEAFGTYYWATAFFKFVNDVFVFISPLFIHTIVSYIDGNKSGLSTTAAFMCAIAIFLSAELQSICLGQYFWRGFRLGLRVRAAIGQVVFGKALKLPYPERQAFGVGAIVSYMQIDAAKVADGIPYLHMIWSAPLQIAIAMGMLYSMLGVAGFAGLAVMIMMMPVNVRVSRRMASFTKRTMAARDRRVKFTNEILGGVRILKLFAWEPAFLAETRAKRHEELKAIFSGAVFGTIATFIWGATPIFVTLATFILYSIIPSNPPLTAASAFTSLAVFNLLRFPLNAVNMTITRIVDLSVVSRRLSRFMSAEETREHSLDELNNGAPLLADGYFRSLRRAGEDEGDLALEVVRGVFRWPEVQAETSKTDIRHAKRNASAPSRRAFSQAETEPLLEPGARLQPTLTDINISLRQGEVLGLCGPVGCGKSSMLSAIIGEIPRVSGRLAVRGRIAYCAQEPWIQNMTLRENILFGLPFDQERYQRVVYACALEADLLQLADGDRSEIGERGINLSGGQKARVALARACYQMADIYVLDDILSAVDAHVGAHLVSHCISGWLKEIGSTVIIATHHTHFLSVADNVIELDEQGRLKPSRPGSYYGAPQPAAAPAASTPASADEAATQIKPVQGGNGQKSIASLTKKEDRERGVVKSSVWATYLKALGTWSMVTLIILYTISQASLVGSSWWLSQWTANTFNQPSDDPWMYIGVYAALSLLAAGLVWFRVLVIAVASTRAGKRLHENALTAVLASPVRFFDQTPLGRIINRLSADLQVVDIQLRMTSQQFFLIVFNVLGTLILLLVNSVYIAVCMLPLGVIYYYCAKYYRHSSREIQRLDSVSKSPVYAAFSEALNGWSTIRAFGAVERFEHSSVRKLDYNLRAGFVSAAANRWLGVRLEALGNVVVALSAIFAVLSHALDDKKGGSVDVKAGLAGLALSYALSLTDFLNYLIRVFTQLETQMVNVERLFDYSQLPPEEPLIVESIASIESERLEWPSLGAIHFQQVSMAYRVDLPPVLNQLDLEVHGGEKVGIVGRTGAGKSSILVALFRVCELRAGAIMIDGVNIATLPLAMLRSRLSIIPQEPVLFSGTLRSNLDPFNKHEDAVLWQVLEECSLAAAMREHPDGLRRPIDERGSNLSMGQRQLVCMGRALLKRSRVLVLDEATASVDMESDAFIQRTLQYNLSGVTVLTIAHRLNTIMHYDRVAVISSGQVAEIGPPHELKEKPGTLFSELWQQVA